MESDTKEMPEPKEDFRFCTITLQLGYVTKERINECVRIQQKLKELGVHTPKIGEVMLDKGYLTQMQINHIFRTQGLKGGHTEIAGYKIIAKIGQGAMGSIYQAQQLSMDRIVAIKILPPKLAQNKRVVERFFREARAVAKLSHPNIIQGIDVGESNGLHYFAMEYIDGPTLKEIIRQSGPFEEKKALEIIIQIAHALDHAHKNNLIHRDIKPGNIMLNKNNIAKLCDLGLARLMAFSSETTPEKRVVLGTPAYISPEQARAEPDVDIRSDIYSLGATFYHLIVGKVPFPAESAAQSIAQHLNQDPIPPREKSPQISNRTNTIILRMMAKKKEERFQTPAELITHLEQALELLKQEIQTAPTPKVLTTKRPYIKTHRFSRLGRRMGRSFRSRRPFRQR